LLTRVDYHIAVAAVGRGPSCYIPVSFWQEDS